MSEFAKALIDEFLQKRRIAVIGVSRDGKDFSRTLFNDLLKRGYDVIPVNPGANEINGKVCYASVRDAPQGIEAALIMTPPQQTAAVVRECAEAGIPLVWMYRAIGSGSVDKEAVAWGRENGLSVIPGYCPYMFLSDAEWFHRVHGFFARITGSYPK